MRRTATALALILPCLAALAGDAGERAPGTTLKQEAAEAADALASYTGARKDEALAAMARALRAVDERLDALELDAGELGSELHAMKQESLAALREQRRGVEEWFRTLERGSKQAWRHARDGFAAAYRALMQSLAEAERGPRSASDEEQRS